jgi:2-polyprenyl-3-methyl-5-hydroxy-6-metoxy-1,4-benzoquinol methylase
VDENKEFQRELANKQKAIETFERVSERYNRAVERGPLKWLRDRERNRILELCRLDTPGGTLIDVGCGAGFYSLYAKRAGYRVHSVDASTGMVMRLSGQVDEIEVADLESLEPHATYDRVLCTGVLDFVLDAGQALHNLAALVAPGGRLIVQFPHRGIGGMLYRVGKRLFGVRTRLYRSARIREMLEREGLRFVGSCRPSPTHLALSFKRLGG